MNLDVNSRCLKLLKDRINLCQIPFSDRGSRLLIFQSEQHLIVRLAERWFKREGQLAAYRTRVPLIDMDFYRWGRQASRAQANNVSASD